MFCSKCGSENSSDVKFCSNCGAQLGTSSSDNSKLFAILSYIGILWLIGLFVKPEKDNAYVRVHVGQGILLSIVSAALYFTVAIFAFVIGFIFGLMGISVLGIIIAVLLEFSVSGAYIFLMVMGIINAAKGEQKQLPVIGKYAFYK